MKKVMTIFGAILFASLILTSCGNKCDYSGCEREATGWKHYSSKQPGPFGGCIGCCRIDSKGGYCSKDHCAEDQWFSENYFTC